MNDDGSFKLLQIARNWILLTAACVAVHGCAVTTNHPPADAEIRAKEIALDYMRGIWSEERLKTRTLAVKKVGRGWEVSFCPPEGTIGGGAVVTIDSALEKVLEAILGQ